MTTRQDASIILDEAERSGACATVSEGRLQRWFERACKGDEVVSPMPGLYARPSTWNEMSPIVQARHCIRALARIHPGWVFVGPSAAVLHGMSVSYRDARIIHVASRRGTSTRTTGRVRRHLLERDGTELVSGVAATSLLRTAFDCLRWLGFRNGLAAADSALRISALERKILVDKISRDYRGLHGWKDAWWGAQHADGRAENGGESYARAAMIELGYTVPDLQRVVHDPVDGTVYRMDYVWNLPDGRCVCGELDGREKYVNPAMTGGRDAVDVLADERLRESRIGADGLVVMRFSFKDVTSDDRFSRILDAYGIPKVA